MAGDGPLCPVDNRHGRTIYMKGDAIHCPHHAHGGNGRTWRSQDDLEQTEQTEEDVSNQIETAAKDIIAGRTTIELATSQIAKQTKRGSAQVRETLNDMLGALQAKSQERDAEREAVKAEREERSSEKAPRKEGAKPKQEHVEPAVFKAYRDEMAMTNKQVSAALEAAGMGHSLSRVTELTHSKGAAASTFEQFKTAMTAWRLANPKAD
jgi:hypothetical protein